jgi:glutaminyl-tRNA synthetase
MRRAGYPPKSIRAFIEAVGVAKNDSFVDVELLEHFVRDELNRGALRRMAILRPLKLIIDNYPLDQAEEFWVSDFPQNPECTTGRKVPFSRELFIEQDDFMENPVPKYFRLSPEREVRLMNAYFVKAVSIDKDAEGRILAVHCTYDPESRGGNAADGRKVKGTIHWVSAPHAIDAEVHLYDYLFKDEHPEDLPEGEVFTDHVNMESLEVLNGCKLEPALAEAKPGQFWQFVRNGYFNADIFSSKPGNLVFIRTLSLVDSWAKQQAQK